MYLLRWKPRLAGKNTWGTIVKCGTQTAKLIYLWSPRSLHLHTAGSICTSSKWHYKMFCILNSAAFFSERVGGRVLRNPLKKRLRHNMGGCKKGTSPHAPSVFYVPTPWLQCTPFHFYLRVSIQTNWNLYLVLGWNY